MSLPKIELTIDGNSVLLVGLAVFIGWNVATGKTPVTTMVATAQTPSNLATKLAETANQYVGTTTQEAGSWVDPSVSCAATTWSMLNKAGIAVAKHAAVTTNGGLVQALQNANWQQVPRKSAIPGCIVWHDKNGPGAHGPEHIGICSDKGCSRAFNTKGGRFVNNAYPTDYSQWIDSNDSRLGGVLCPQ